MTDRYDGWCQGEEGEEEEERYGGTQKEARHRESARSMPRRKEAEETAVLLPHEGRQTLRSGQTWRKCEALYLRDEIITSISS